MKKLLLLLLLATTAAAQSRVDVEINQVNDRRSKGFFSKLTIALDLPKVRSTDVVASRVLVTSATDDSGQSLLDSEAQEPQLELNSSAMFVNNPEAKPVTVSVVLKNPDRKAKTVKEVKGEIELFMPSKDPNSIAEIAKFLSLSGKPLSHKALKANGVEIAMLSPAQVDAERKRLGEAKKKEWKDSGWSGQDLDNMVASFLESLLRVEENEVVLRVKDPSKRIQEIVYVDASGEVKRASMRTDEGLTMLTTWGDKPQPDWKLRVSMKTPKNLVRHTFALSNVPLP